MAQYDLIIIGGGPAGYNAAERAAHGGLKTLLIEKNALGGVCLNEGCIPSKTLLNSAKMYDHALHSAKYGVTAENVKIDQEKVVERKCNVVNMLVSGVTGKMRRAKVKVVKAAGEIVGKTAEGFEVKANDEVFSGKNLLITTGSTAVVPPIPGLREGIGTGFVVTNHEIFDVKQIPEKLVVIGGGVIGLEMASYFCSVGSKVTIIEMLDHIAGATDSEIAKLLQDTYAKKGVEFKLGCKVTAVEAGKVIYEQNGATAEAPADLVLCSIGRRAVTQGVGLENIGVYMERGAIKTDEQMRTNISGVYAAGDVNGVSMLAHTAYREGEVAVNTILGKPDRMRYTAIPGVIYTNPEVASVGLTLDQAKEKGYDADVVKMTALASGRYVAENEGGNGFCKVVYDKKYNRVLGVHMIGGYPSESIYGASMMIETEMRIENLKEIVFPHPTVCEVIREALFEI